MSDFEVVTEGNPLYAELDRLKRELDALADALRTAIITLERDGDEWNICDTLRAALAQVRK